MKKTIFILAVALLASSCGVYKGYVQSKPFEFEKTIQPDFNNYLKTKPNLSVVLRVPTAASGVTQEEVSKNNAFYLQVEKNLMRQGFEVRDRNLLNLLLESGVTDYGEIARKTAADVIIEIISVTYPDATREHTQITLDKPRPKQLYYLSERIRIAVAMIEFKLVQVENNKTGAISTFYLGNGSTFYYRKKFIGSSPDDIVHTGTMRFVQDQQRVIDEFSKYLISMLKGEE
jgi:hypothetical protein